MYLNYANILGNLEDYVRRIPQNLQIHLTTNAEPSDYTVLCVWTPLPKHV